MKRLIYGLVVSLAMASLATAQESSTNAKTTGSTDSTATGNVAGRSFQLQSGTQVAAQLQNTLDVRKAKVGDQVVFKTTKALKSEGQTIVDKGARLIGHVTEVGQRSKSSGSSHVTLLFDRIEKGSLSMPIVATINSITRGNAAVRMGDESFIQSSSSNSTQGTVGAGPQGNPGLLGGVTNTAGGVVGGAVSTVGSTVGTTTGAVGSTVDNTTTSASSLTRSLSRIQISESAGASAQGGSTLSLQSDNLRLEKGTNFNLVLIQSASTTREP
jgi:hypothetical protein